MGGQMRQDVLRALGDGGTMDMVDGVLRFLEPLLMAGASTAAEPDPFADEAETELELAGLAEVAELLGRPKQSVGHWVSGRRGPGNFPAPLATLAAGPVWNAREIKLWCDAHGIPWLEDIPAPPVPTEA